MSRRFAVLQCEKVRPIENYIESLVNSGATITNTNTCRVDSIDTIAATACSFMKVL